VAVRPQRHLHQLVDQSGWLSVLVSGQDERGLCGLLCLLLSLLVPELLIVDIISSGEESALQDLLRQHARHELATELGYL
jgi:hypothetical protein